MSRIDLKKESSRPEAEKTVVRLGFIPLTDCAPLVVAREHGYFAEEGLEVILSREHSWASIRDKVSLGILDGAQMLASMPVAARLGVCGPQLDFVSAFVMDLNGNAITLDNTLFQRIVDIEPGAAKDPLLATQALKQVIDADRIAGRPRTRFGVVFPASTQNYELHYWLASGGIDPAEDVEVIVEPPAEMVSRMKAGDIAGFCVGEPWNTHAVFENLGHVVATKYQLWNNSPEKVFAVSQEWAQRHPHTHRAIVRALMRASLWLDKAENRQSAAALLTDNGYIELPLETVALSLTGKSLRHPDSPPEHAPDFHVFHRYSANFPWLNHAEWFIAQMYRWGQIDTPVDIARTSEQVFLPNLYREIAHGMGIPCPAINRKTEGNLTEKMLLEHVDHIGPNRFLDGQRFEVGGIIKYLEQQLVNKADLEALRSANES